MDHSNNAYRIVLQPLGTVPLGEPATVVAYVAEDDRLVKLEDIQVIASVAAPDGSRWKLELHDDGAGADQVAAMHVLDAAAGVVRGWRLRCGYGAVLADFNHSLTSFSSFRAEAYPSVLVDSLDVGELVPGERTHIADVLVHIASAPTRSRLKR